MKIAGYPAQVTSLFDSTRDYCRNYLTEEKPEFFIAVTPEDLAFEQKMLDEEAAEEGIRRRRFTEPFLERAAIQRKFAEYLFERNVLLFHGSAVAVDGEGYLFTAKCGTGKSTHTRLWRQVFGQRAVMVNDDKPFLQITEDGVQMHGAPWSGKHGLDTNITVSLKGICILERGTENRIWPVEAGTVMNMLQKQACAPLDASKEADFRKLVKQLSEKTALWKMECNKEEQAAVIAYAVMCDENRTEECVL